MKSVTKKNTKVNPDFLILPNAVSDVWEEEARQERIISNFNALMEDMYNFPAYLVGEVSEEDRPLQKEWNIAFMRVIKNKKSQSVIIDREKGLEMMIDLSYGDTLNRFRGVKKEIVL